MTLITKNCDHSVFPLLSLFSFILMWSVIMLEYIFWDFICIKYLVNNRQNSLGCLKGKKINFISLDKVLWRYVLYPFDLLCYLAPMIIYFAFILFLCIVKYALLNLSTISVTWLFYEFTSYTIYYMKLVTLHFGTYIFRIILSRWWIFLLMKNIWPYLSLCVSLGIKFILLLLE